MAMKVCARVSTAVLVICGILLLAGCPTRTSVEKINRDPGRYAGKEVTIAGKVSGSFGALGSGIFQIDDGTGTMWEMPLPSAPKEPLTFPAMVTSLPA